MLVTLIGKNSMHKIVLPQVPVGNYWLSDTSNGKDKKLVNIEGKNGNWQISSNNFARIINSKCINITDSSVKMVPASDVYSSKTILKEYSMYAICLGHSDDVYILYCSPVYENNFIHLDIKSNTQDIFIGSNKQNLISYSNALVADKHAHIFFSNGCWMIRNFDQRYGTFVNGLPVGKNPKPLLNGDIIFIMGLKIIMMGDSLFINNPKNNMTYSNLFFTLSSIRNIEKYVPNVDEDNDENIELYSEDDYFSRAPRITNIIEQETVKIDPPPQAPAEKDTPAILVLGSTLTMGVVTMVSMVNTVNNTVSGKSSIRETILSLIVSIAMLIGVILFPVINMKYQRKSKVEYEEKRQSRYKEYLNSKRSIINLIMAKQRNILIENYVSAQNCANIILQKDSRLWERKIEDYDFLSVRLGIGDVPLKIDIKYPEERFTMEDDNLVDILNDIADNSKILKSSPIVTSLVEKNVSALIVNDDSIFKRFIEGLIVQLVTFQSYSDLKLVFLINKDNEQYWEYVKMLPHVWNNAKDFRFFASNYDEMSEISLYLEEELKNRLQYDKYDYKSFSPYYLIITDDYSKIENLKFITEFLKAKINVGFSMLCITNSLTQLPNECKTFISIENETGMLFENELSSSNQKKIILDSSNTFNFEKICQTLSNIPIRYASTDSLLLPNNYTFLEMYDAGLIEQLNVLERWRKNDSTLSLKAPLGIDPSGRIISLDVHEKFHGPHGLIAGSTGSGKSEFIITYILSLAINYHPDDVSFLLIDYKGGGLAGAFEKGNIKLPHLVGTITNIDTNGLQRSLASIESELRRRQVIFNNTRNVIDEGTMDIYKYQKLYHQGFVHEPIPHLLIICDEFAELKQQQPDFMDELISVSRIGRSLGIHLILATQKPAGIVNDQIRSNSKFAICLKVQDKSDSTDVIKRPDAANLKTAGQFFMQVGNDDYFVLGQSAWSGAPYFPSNVTKKKIDDSIQFISNIGTSIKEVNNTLQKVVSNKGEQLTNIVKYIYTLARQENIKTHNLWLDNIPETIFLDDVKKKYHFIPNKDNIEIAIGEYDDPYNQRQDIVKLNLSTDGNTIVYGSAESGKETLLSTVVYDLISEYSSEKVWLYLLDFGSEALKIYKDSSSVGDIIFMNDDEKLQRFFDMIQNEIKNRKSILSNYNGDFDLYIQSGNSLPMIVIILNNYEAFAEVYEKYEDIFLSLTREGTKFGIDFLLTASSYNSLRYRLTQNFKRKITLQLNNSDDYYNILEKAGKRKPSNIFGRGLISIDDNIYEFQTAKICETENYNSHIAKLIESTRTSEQISAPKIPVIPSKVTMQDVISKLKNINNLPLGITQSDLKIYTYDFKKNFINIVTGKNIEDTIEFVSNVLEEIKKLKEINLNILDAERTLETRTSKEDYTKFILSIGLNSAIKNITNVCVIIGFDKFLVDLEGGEKEFFEILKKAEAFGNCAFIIVDNANRLKNHEYDSWYKNYITKDNGIYVGNGFDDQYLITVNDRRRFVNNCGKSYGYAIKDGNPTLIKLLGMKDSGDENE